MSFQARTHSFQCNLLTISPFRKAKKKKLCTEYSECSRPFSELENSVICSVCPSASYIDIIFHRCQMLIMNLTLAC